MLGYVLIGTLAAFGLMCAVWILCGVFLVRSQGWLLYRGQDARGFAQRYLWLRELGLLHCPLCIVEPEPETEAWLEGQGIEICSRGELLSRLGIGAEEN